MFTVFIPSSVTHIECIYTLLCILYVKKATCNLEVLVLLKFCNLQVNLVSKSSEI